MLAKNVFTTGVESMTGSAHPYLEVKDLIKSFKDRKRKVTAVDGISFGVTEGEMIGLLGPNGAGKTTTIKCILGLVKPDSGIVRIDKIDPAKDYRAAIGKMAAVLEGARNTYWRLSVWENLQFFAGIHGVCAAKEKDYLEHLLELLKLTDKRNIQVGNLSSGYKQKTAVVCALAKKTPLVFLDEPTLGLDVEASYELRSALKNLQSQERRTIIVSSHDMRVIQDVCSRAIIITGGRVVADESIQNLLQLFRTRNYKIVVPVGTPSHDSSFLINQIKQEFPLAQMTQGRDTLEITADFQNPFRVYELIEVLRDAKVTMESLSQEQVDLEKVFLEIVRKENSRVVNSA